MKPRLAFHLLLLIVLGAVGARLLQLELMPVKQGGIQWLDGLAGAMYWFAFLVFGLLSSLFYLALRRVGVVPLVAGYLVSAALAAGATLAIVRAGRQAAVPDDAELLQLPQQSESGVSVPRPMPVGWGRLVNFPSPGGGSSRDGTA
jgi:hypothetical protein